MDLITKGNLALQGVFERFNVAYGLDGISANVRSWADNKLPIIDALRRHPNWNEDALAVVMNVTERRGDNAEATRSAIDNIQSYLLYEKNLPVLSNIVNTLHLHLRQKNITQECVDAARALATAPPVMPSVGMKTSRFIRKLCEAFGVDVDGDAGFRTRFATFADTVSPYDVVRPLLFSVNPADYALMSHGNSWSSCQSIIPRITGGRGEYRAGCFSYMNDGSTIVSYTVDYLPENMSTVCLMPKLNRQLYYLSNDGKLFIQSRSYPAANKETRRDMRRVAHTIFSQVFGFDNMWGPPKRSGNKYASQMDSHHYPDYQCFSDSTTLSYAVEVKEAVESGQYNGIIRIGELPMCIHCGMTRVAHSGTLYCYECKPEDEDNDDDNYDEDGGVNEEDYDEDGNYIG